MAEKKVTMSQVAKAANISVSTLSRYLHGRGRVSNEKILRIQKAINDLHYQIKKPSKLAAHRANSQTVGIVVQYALCPQSNATLAALEDGLKECNLAPIVCICHWDRAIEQHRIQLLLDQGIDGLIIIGGGSTSEQIRSQVGDLPVIAIGSIEGENSQLHNISTNNQVGGYIATNHLLRLGHSRVAHIAGLAFQHDAKARLSGYKDALRKAGIRYDSSLVVYGSFDVESGASAVRKLLAQKAVFSAIFVANDQMAFGAIKQLKKVGLRVPEDISIIGFDNHEVADSFSPPLTTIHHPARLYGLTAVSEMAKLLGISATPTIPLDMVQNLSVVERDSCCPKVLSQKSLALA